MILPEVPISYAAVVVCGVVALVLGFIWYGPLFGKTWMKLEGFPEDAAERAKTDPAMRQRMYMGYFLQFVLALISAIILDHFLVFGNTYLQTNGMVSGLRAGLFLWIGFTLPPTLGMVLWEGKPWKLWVITAGYWLVLFPLMGIILVYSLKI